MYQKKKKEKKEGNSLSRAKSLELNALWDVEPVEICQAQDGLGIGQSARFVTMVSVKFEYS